jgi:hypothetical protein
MDKQETKELMKPRQLWTSVVLVPDPRKKFKDVPASERPLVKVKAQGTFRKADNGGKAL